MSEQIPLIEVEAVPLPQRPPPPGGDIYLISAYRKGWGFHLRRSSGNEEYASFEAAEKAAHDLPGMWTHIEIHHLRLGGGK